jgi:hypothetical protein
MQRSAPALLPLLRSNVQGALLALLYLHPDAEYSLSEAASIIGASVKAVHSEASRLVENGFAADRRVGNVRLVRAVQDSIVARPLTDLLAVTYGPMPVLTDLLAIVGGIQHAFIYGSWAARYLGEPGPIPNDVDVLVVGTADRDELDAVAQDAQHRLLRPVSIRRVLPRAWESPEPADAFLATVRERPLLALRVGIGAGTQP